MSALGLMDLPYLVESRDGKVDDLALVGVLIGEVEPPPHFEGITLRDRNDRFALVELVGAVTSFGKYYARGKIFTVVNKNLLDIAKGKESGKLAVQLTRGSTRNNKRAGLPNFIHMMNWSKGQFNAWQVGRVEATGFRKNDHPEFFDMIAKAYKNNWQFEYPIQISQTYTDSCKDFEFALIGGNQDQPITPQGWNYTGVPQNPVQPPRQQQQSVPTNLFGQTGNLGTSDSSNIQTLIDNRAVTHAEVKNKTILKIENRDKILPRTDNIKEIERFIDNADEKVQAIIKSLAEFSGDSEEDKFITAIEFTAERIKSSWTRKIGAMTGRMLFKESLERVLPDFSSKDANNSSPIDMTLNALDTKLVDAWVNYSGEYEDNKFINEMSEKRTEIYLQMIEVLLGIWGKLTGSLFLVNASDIDMLKLLKTNPYNLCYIDPRIDVEDLDKLAMMYGVNISNPDVMRSRNVAYMHNYMLDSSNPIVEDNTVVKYDQLILKVSTGYILTKRSHDTLQVEGTVVNRDRIESLVYYINEETKEESFRLPKAGWKPDFRKYVLPLKQNKTEVVKDYIDSGLGVFLEIEGERYVSDFVFAKKEMYIYNRLRELSEKTKTKDITSKDIEKCIKDFETLKAKEYNLKQGEFKLEDRQADAVRQIKNPIMCLTGPAGSGKTTTAEALVYAIETLLGVKEDEIMFCAPTGKAANRLKEVVKRKTRTINSLFGIGGDGMALRDESNVRVKDDIKVLIVDESSMPNINLMYEMMLRIADGTRIFFLGDIEQLPPIGFGKPFAIMLSFLPTVVLNVTKRASDNSGITLNSKAIIYESDGVVKDLVEKPDFKIVNDRNQKTVVDRIASICKYHLGKEEAIGFTPVENSGTDMNPDDIQVISPINKHDWGTVNLNKVLQDIFNPRKPNEKYVNFTKNQYESTEFRKGDRVTHTRENHSERTRLIQIDGPQFIKHESTGISNGEVGKVVGFYNAKSLDFSGELNDEVKKELEQEFRGTENVMFMAVSFKGIDENTGDAFDFVILYRMEILNATGTHFDVISRDLNNVELAYALTVHKLQGSEAKLVIVVMLPVRKEGFISRNMIYTAISRGKQSGYLIGDVLGTHSCVNKGRKVEQTSKRVALLDKM